MSAIGVIATLTVAEGKNADFEAVFAELSAAVRANEPGNLFYTLTRSRSNPQVYKVLEQYVDQDALTAHGASAYFKAAGPKLGPCLAGAPEIEYLDALSGLKSALGRGQASVCKDEPARSILLQ